MYFFIIIATGKCYSQPTNDHVVLINIGEYKKTEITEAIQIANSFSPRVIALDMAFREYTGDAADRKLFNALMDVNNLVLPSEITSDGTDTKGQEITSIYFSSAPQFFTPRAKTGFVSVAVSQDQLVIPSQFYLWIQGSYSNDIYKHFSLVTAMAFDSSKAANYLERHGRVDKLNSDFSERKFKTFSIYDLISGKARKNDFNNKILLFGFLGPGNDDKFYTQSNLPMNQPNIYGLEYLANIVAQILEKH